MRVTFLEAAEETSTALRDGRHRLLILDVDGSSEESLDAALQAIGDGPAQIPVVLVSLDAEKGPMLRLLENREVSHLVAKHGAIRVSKSNPNRATYSMLDERELLVTCEKVLSGDIFGIDKYIGAWGIALQRRVIKSMRDKSPFLDEFERYVRDLELPQPVVPEIVTVAEELVLNAIVHAPRDANGTPKYEHIGPDPDLTLEADEWVTVMFGCDGQKLMVSVSDNFGTLRRKTLSDYLRRGFGAGASLEPESKASGAGLGLSLSLRSIHQLIFNVHDQKRTEAIAGWFLRIHSASEFKQVGKSLNLFYRHAGAAAPMERSRSRESVYLRGRIDETFDFAAARECSSIDLREVTAITSHGVMRWIEFLRSIEDAELIALPESFVFHASRVKGFLGAASVRTVLVPFECESCGFEERRELPPDAVLSAPAGTCPECDAAMKYGGLAAEYSGFLETLRR